MKKIAILLFVFVLAFSIRAVFVTGERHLKLESDEEEYDRLAVNLMNGRGYINSDDGAPTSLRPPLYPASVALIYKIFGHGYFPVHLVQAALSALTACLLFLIAFRIFNLWAAILTGIFSSFYMTFVTCSGLLYTETLFTFLVVVSAYLIITAGRPGILKFCVIGVLGGLSTLVRSNGFVIPLIAAIMLFRLARDREYIIKADAVRSFFALLLCFAVVLTPWIIRNHMVHGKMVFVSTNGGLNAYQAVTLSQGKIYEIPKDDGVLKKAGTISNEADRNSFYMRSAANFYKANPLRAINMFFMRGLFFMHFIDWEIMGGSVINYHFIFILPFAILGTIFSLKDKKDAMIIFLFIISFASFILLFPGTARYRMPIDGFLIMLGSYGIWVFLRQMRVRAAIITVSYFFFTYLLYLYSPQTKYLVKSLMVKIGMW